DLEGALWLEQFLAKYPHTIVVVSHDRDVLNTSVNAILHLDRLKLTLYAGGYDAFEAARRERQRLDLKLMKKQEDARRHIESFVDRFRAKASKARQAQSRIKALEKMQPIAAAIDDDIVPFSFPAPERLLASPLVRLESAAVGYEPETPVLSDVSLRLDHDDRIGLLGMNGNGKSTFAKLVAGRLAPQEGARYASKKMVVGFFAQHQMDELDPSKSPYDIIRELMPDATEAQRRARLGAIGFGAAKADTVCAKLSGGEKARMLFAIATFHEPHLLILDEPTNHLDVDSRAALVNAINAYAGAVILISHDRHLLEACAERLWHVHDGTVVPYEDDLEAYRRACLSERSGRRARRKKDRAEPSSPASRSGTGEKPVDDQDTAASKSERRRVAAEAREQVSDLRKAIRAHERELEKISAALEKIDERLSEDDLFARAPEKAAELARKRARLVEQRELREAAWLSASEKLENAAA
ncbi:MAG: ATP-binding cassette domain-containing protein, partial [Pseudomonadota bacterium]